MIFILHDLHYARSSFCMMYKFFIKIGGYLADKVDSQGNNLFGLQRWERSKQFSGTNTHTLAFEDILA